MTVHEITTRSELDRHLASAAAARVVVLDFFATWCGPCRQIAPFYQDLSGQHASKAVFLKADADKAKELAQALGVKALPTFIFFHKGQQVGMVRGANQAELASTLKNLVGRCSAFGGAGHSLTGPSTAAAPAAAAPAAAAGGAAPRRRNPWADPNWKPPGMRAAEAKPAAAAAPAAAANKPASAAAAKPAAAPPAPVAAPAAPAADPLVKQLADMGFESDAATRALRATGGRSVDAALNWLLAGNDGGAGDGAAAAAPAADTDLAPPPADGPSMADDVAEMDPAMREIVEATRKRKEAEARKRAKAAEARAAGDAAAAAAADGGAAPKKAVKDMTSEEKEEWLERRRAEVKAKRQKEALESQVRTEKNRRDVGRAALDLKRTREEQAAKLLIAKKKREEKERKAKKKAIQAKLRAEKEARLKAREADRKRAEALRAQKGQ